MHTTIVKVTAFLVSAVLLGAAFPINEVLREHNIYRCMHGVPLLTWNAKIAQQAQSWTQQTRGVMRHGGMDGYSGGRLGQNLAGLLPQYGWNEKKGVDMWYDEIKHTNSGIVTSFGMTTGHYTQVVWRGTREIGCGEWVRGTCNNGGNPCLLACDYFPAGNMQGAFRQNVNSPVKSKVQCEREIGGGAVPSPTPPPPRPGSSCGYCPSAAYAKNCGGLHCAPAYPYLKGRKCYKRCPGGAVPSPTPPPPRPGSSCGYCPGAAYAKNCGGLHCPPAYPYLKGRSCYKRCPSSQEQALAVSDATAATLDHSVFVSFYTFVVTMSTSLWMAVAAAVAGGGLVGSAIAWKIWKRAGQTQYERELLG